VFLLFGFRNRINDRGATIAATCPRCHNSVVLHDVHSRRWFTLFFIPVLPLGRARRVLMCPVCRWGRDVAKQADALTTEMAGITREWQAGGMADDAYGQRVDAYWSFATPAGHTADGDDVPAS
jgi:hypothetical protein